MPSRAPSLAASLFLLAQIAVAAPQKQPAIRSTTRLVQVSVVALDSHGNPITGLTKEDFSISDEGHPQTISIFAAETPAPAAPVKPLPPNVFTNRFDLKGQDPGAVTIILFDALNTANTDQSYARLQILKFLRTLAPQDHVAIYALTNTKLFILHDFTRDSAALVNAVNNFTPQQSAAFDASTQSFIDLVGMTGDTDWARFQGTLNNANGEIADEANINRVATTASALEAIADHVAVVPGRKSLVWISGGFPLQLGLGRIGNGDRSDIYSNEDVLRTGRALNRSNISIYPVDVRGVELNSGLDPASRGPGNATGTFTSFYTRQNRLDSFKLLADRTGGVAFYGNNDIRAGIRRAFDDGRFAYTIGFYPDHGSWDGKFREIKVRVNTRGVQLRYRKGYFASPELATPETAIASDLKEAASSPLDSTSLGLIVLASPGANSGERVLELRITVDPKQLLLNVSGGHRKGALDMMFQQNSHTGDAVAAAAQHLDLNLTEEQFTAFAASGIILVRHVTVSPQAAEIRVIVRDSASGSLGSVAIPVGNFFAGASAGDTSSKPL